MKFKEIRKILYSILCRLSNYKLHKPYSWITYSYWYPIHQHHHNNYPKLRGYFVEFLTETCLTFVGIFGYKYPFVNGQSSFSKGVWHVLLQHLVPEHWLETFSLHLLTLQSKVILQPWTDNHLLANRAYSVPTDKQG